MEPPIKARQYVWAGWNVDVWVGASVGMFIGIHLVKVSSRDYDLYIPLGMDKESRKQVGKNHSFDVSVEDAVAR